MTKSETDWKAPLVMEDGSVRCPYCPVRESHPEGYIWAVLPFGLCDEAEGLKKLIEHMAKVKIVPDMRRLDERD